jgi:hypothetical protein
VRLIEVCAGSAAVTLAAVGGKLPLYYRGGKRRHARQILTALQGLAASRSAGGFTSFTLNEPGMFGTFWAVVRQTPFRKALVAELRALHAEAQGRTAREFWQALVAAPVPCVIDGPGAVGVALQRHPDRDAPDDAAGRGRGDKRLPELARGASPRFIVQEPQLRDEGLAEGCLPHHRPERAEHARLVEGEAGESSPTAQGGQLL